MVEKGASSLGKYIFPIYKYIITYKFQAPISCGSQVLKQTKE